MAAAVNLTALAAQTEAALAVVWDDLGVSIDDRTSYINRIAEDVAALYHGRVASQEQLRADTEAEIASLQSTIDNMHHAMQEVAAVPVRAGKSLLAYRDALDAYRAELQVTWDARYAELKALEGSLRGLYADVGSPVEPAFEAVGDAISIARIAAYKTEIGRVGAIKTARGEAIAALCGTVQGLLDEMALEPRDAFEAAVAKQGEGLGWSQAVVDTLTAKIAALNEQKAAREERIAAVGAEIMALWKRLATPEDEQAAFLEEHAGLGDAVIAACEAYRTKKRAEFGAKLVELMAGVRASVAAVWDSMRAGPAQRAAMFPGFHAPAAEFTAELFEAHEAYLAAATAQAGGMGELLKAVEKRAALLADKAEYEAIISNPDRLLAKGSSAARLREEKLERRVKKELPVLSKRLRAQVLEWEAANGTAFMIEDARYVDTLDAEEAAEARANEEARAARAASRSSAVGAGGDALAHKPSVPRVTAGGAAPAASSASSSSSAAAAAAPGAGASGRLSVFAKPGGLSSGGSGVAAAGAAAMKRGPTPAASGGPASGGPRKTSAGASSCVSSSLSVVSDGGAGGSVSDTSFNGSASLVRSGGGGGHGGSSTSSSRPPMASSTGGNVRPRVTAGKVTPSASAAGGGGGVAAAAH